ncbi:hypothetical protein [Paraburkholderia sacchari]|uniref:hypothetical protein n=1 Tax=Paraburkholderia sacchari TaxID=159450 RepID=UPI003D9917D2
MKRRRISPSSWRLARVLWEADAGVTYGDVGKRLGVTRQAVFQHGRAAGWVRHECGDPLLVGLADAGLSRRLPVASALSLAEILREMEQAIGGVPMR